MTDLPVQEFYRVYTSYCETHCITPLSKINASRILSNELDEIDIEGIDAETPKKPASDPKALDKFLANIYSIPANNPQDVQEKPVEEKSAPVEEKPTEEQPVPKKTAPPVPPKPDFLKVKLAPVIKEDSVPEEPPASDEEPDQEDTPPAEEPAPEADDDYDVLDDLLSDPAPEQQSESPMSSISVTKPDPEPAPEEHPIPVPEEPSIPEPDTESEIDRDPEPKQGTKAHWAWYERHRWDRKPWVKNSKDQTFSDLYNTGKDLWAKYQDESDEYDWDILAFEVEECPTYVKDEYQYYLREVVDRFKDWVEYNGDSPKAPSRKEFADLIRAYKEDRNAEIIPTPSGCETMRLDKGKAREIPEELPKTDMEREWEAANGYVDWDEEDLDCVCSKIDSF
ncbi:unnamed protein product [Rhizophagus irregularis]|nr:unnamed protein product [Rhizophagus irregularis]